jgi:glycosyltransferase involved in cell wall biosynthesis
MSKKLKEQSDSTGFSVLQIPHVYFPRTAGIQYYVLNLSRYLLSQNISVEILSTIDGVRGLKQTYKGIKTTWVPAFPRIGRNPIAPSVFIRLLNKHQSFSLLHLHGSQLATTFYASTIRKSFASKPLILTSHGIVSNTTLRGVLRGLLGLANVGARFSLLRADSIIALTNHEVSLLQEIAGVDISEKIHVIPNATNISEKTAERLTYEESRKKLGLSNEFVILFVGVLRPRKGLRFLLESLRYLSISNFRCYIIGDGVLRSQLEDSVPPSLKGNVRFLGRLNQDTLLPFYSASDVIVLPSLQEGFPTVVLESWMFGKPVVLTDIPVHNEILSDSKGGLLVKVGSSKAIAQAIQYLHDNPQSRRRLGKNGKTSVLKHYTWTVVGNQIKELYRKTLNQ